MALGIWERLGKPSRVLIVGTNSSMYTWMRLVPEWVGATVIHLTGDQTNRTAILRKVKDAYFLGETLFVCCNYSILRREVSALKALPFQMLIVDEAHKARNRKTASWAALKELRSKTKYFVAASATLASRGPQDLWGILHLLDAKKFGSYWQFINTYCHVFAGRFGREILGVKNPAELRRLLHGNYYTTRTYQEVMPQLPPVTREVIELSPDTDPVQWSVYKQLDKEMIAYIREAVLEGEEGEKFRTLMVPNVLSKITRLRQLLVCPQLLGVDTLGVGLSYLKEMVEDDPHTVIFTPFAEALPLIEQVLKEVDGVTCIRILRGGMKPEEVKKAIDEFKAQEGIMLCSIAFAESFSLDTVHTAYFLGYSWDPNENEQAEGRLRRLDSKDFQGVVVKYIVHAGTIDDRIRDVLNGKAMNVNLFMRNIASSAPPEKIPSIAS